VIPNISLAVPQTLVSSIPQQPNTIFTPRSALFSDTTAIASYDLLVLALGLSAEIPFLLNISKPQEPDQLLML